MAKRTRITAAKPCGYVHEIDNFEFIDGVIDAMRELKKWALRWW